jgi:hypothetical protein
MKRVYTRKITCETSERGNLGSENTYCAKRWKRLLISLSSSPRPVSLTVMQRYITSPPPHSGFVVWSGEVLFLPTYWTPKEFIMEGLSREAPIVILMCRCGSVRVNFIAFAAASQHFESEKARGGAESFGAFFSPETSPKGNGTRISLTH